MLAALRGLIFWLTLLVCGTAPKSVSLTRTFNQANDIVSERGYENLFNVHRRSPLQSRAVRTIVTTTSTQHRARPTQDTTSKPGPRKPCTDQTSTTSKTASKARFKQWLGALSFLRKFNYLSPHLRGNHDIKTAVEIYQRFMHLPVSGRLDNTTLREMAKPRCGVPDLEIDDPGLGRRRKRFAVSDKKWLNVSLLYAFESYTADMSQLIQKAVIAKAFKMWSDVSPFTFTPTTDSTKSHIKILFGTWTHGSCRKDFDGPGKVIAHAYYPSDGRLHFDDDETYTDGVSSGTNLLAIAVHEIGHILGIAHSTDPNSVMYPKYDTYKPNLHLHTEDINAIAYLYAGGTATPDTGISVCQDANPLCLINVSMCFTNPDAMKMSCPKTCQFCV